MELPKDIQLEINMNQNQLKNAIRNHQILVWKSKEDPDNEDIKLEIQEIYKEIVEIGQFQRNIVERLRKAACEPKPIQKPGLEERRFNLANVLNKTRKQAIVSRSASLSPLSPPSDESQGTTTPPPSGPKTPESNDDDISTLLTDSPKQSDFLVLFGLCTHEVFKELQNKRVERKRRSTANPHFLYGNHWENNKIKRRKNVYLQSNFSPPNTRSSSMRRQKEERRLPSPPVKSESRSVSPVIVKKQPISAAIGLNIPNLPSGLTIERVDSNSNSPDLKTCIICRLPSGLSLCDKCDSHFHISCHNRPLTSTPRYCPRCVPKRERDLTSLREPVSMTVVVGNGMQMTREFKERLEDKKRLQEQNVNLNNQMNILKTRHAELTISLKTQEEEKKELLICEQSTKENIQRILDFVKNIKGTNNHCNITTEIVNTTTNS